MSIEDVAVGVDVDVDIDVIVVQSLLRGDRSLLFLARDCRTRRTGQRPL